MNITMLGTGNAMVTECYNTCFVLEDGDKHLLVDGGGGNTLLRQLKQAGFDWKDMREIFVTHKHVDHIMGVVWMIRMICQNMKQGQYDGEQKTVEVAIEMCKGEKVDDVYNVDPVLLTKDNIADYVTE